MNTFIFYGFNIILTGDSFIYFNHYYLHLIHEKTKIQKNCIYILIRTIKIIL